MVATGYPRNPCFTFLSNHVDDGFQLFVMIPRTAQQNNQESKKDGNTCLTLQNSTPRFNG